MVNDDLDDYVLSIRVETIVLLLKEKFKENVDDLYTK